MYNWTAGGVVWQLAVYNWTAGLAASRVQLDCWRGGLAASHVCQSLHNYYFGLLQCNFSSPTHVVTYRYNTCSGTSNTKINYEEHKRESVFANQSKMTLLQYKIFARVNFFLFFFFFLFFWGGGGGGGGGESPLPPHSLCTAIMEVV